MKSFKQYIIEGRPKGQKRYDRDTRKLEARLDKMYEKGVSQKKLDRAEMRLARRTNEYEYDIDDQPNPILKSHETHLDVEESPKSWSLEDLMRDKAKKIYTDRYGHEKVGAEIRSGLVDLHQDPQLKSHVTDAELGQEAHRMLDIRNALVKKLKHK